uniref:Tetratricopeptide repeat-containing protein n=1 Tax=Candidatus Kentrum sp. TUN TaxID=2126343 RepID=A0A450ZI51_9GAMM|nr:MAG: Tetratricopeptide repeat-containing protein [Candidatus Kentron sp. TUN]VFK54814.1 MAG: Tetratricopeptide repeat-containing protein [Candidatus Kentron sp. TUN]
MNEYYLREAREEAEFLRKRAWDFIDKLEKLEPELKTTTDAGERQSLQTRIENARSLRDDYQRQYQAMCEEAGIPLDNLTPNAPGRDIVSTFGRKALETREDLVRRQEIDLPPFFALVPARNPRFTGRQEAVRQFIRRVLQGGAFAICGVKGMGGIGKTEIAMEVCHLFHETWQARPQLPEYMADLLAPANAPTNTMDGFFRDGILWVRFEPEYQTPKSLTEYLIPELADPRTAEKIPDLAALADILASKDVLVVLDSVEQNLRTFDYVLARFRDRFPLIITSRIAIPGIHAVDIDVLTDAEAEELFLNHLETPNLTDAQRGTVRDLCQLVGNFPLGIRIIASRVDPDNGNLTALKTTYQEDRRLLLTESGRDTRMERRNADVRACFMLSFRTLDEPEQRAFLHAALFNNPFTVPALAALLAEPGALAGDTEGVQRIVGRLHRLSLVSRTREKAAQPPADHWMRPSRAHRQPSRTDVWDTYELHPLMREFALDLLSRQTETLPGKKEAIAQLLAALQEDKKQGRLLERLQQDRALVRQAVEAMAYCDRTFDFATVGEFMNVLNGPLNNLGYWEDKIRLNRLTIRAAVALQQRASEAFWRRQLADTLQRRAVFRAELEAVRGQWEEILSIARELKQANGIVFTQYRLASIERDLRHWTTAIRNNYQGIRTACRYGEVYWLGAFIRSIGQIHNAFAGGETGVFFRLNLKITANDARETWQKSNLLRAYGDSIDVLFTQGRIEAALPHYQQNLQLALELKHAQLATVSFRRLFDCALHLLDAQISGQYLNDFERRSTAMGLAESRRQDMAARLAWLREEYDTAIQVFSAAMVENDLDQDYYHYWLGKSYLYRGDLDQAAEHLHRALAHQEHKNAVEVARVHSQLALLALKRGETRQAVQNLSISRKTQRAHGIIPSPEEKQIEQAIRAQLTRDGVKPAEYEHWAEEAGAIDLKPDFLFPALPPTHTGQDGKTMLLIPAGPVFIGRGTIDTPTTEALMDDIERYLYPYRQHSDQYPLPPHPDSVFDEDQLLFLLEKNAAMSEGQKQEMIAKLPDMPEQEIQAFIAKLDREYRAANPKATEIYLYPYYMDRAPVSNAEYRAFCVATEHPYPTHWPTHWPESEPPENAEALPVVNITLADAKAYAEWAGKEIPTAQEWEKACRGKGGTLYPWGDAWDESQVKAGDGTIRKEYEETFRALNHPDRAPGIVNLGDGHIFTIPPHPAAEFDDEYFLDLLEHSVRLTLEEKRKLVDGIPHLSKGEIEELVANFIEEREQFAALEKEYPEHAARLKRERYDELRHPPLFTRALEYLQKLEQNQGPYGIRDLVGSIHQFTISERGDGFLIKGGSWFSENPKEACRGWAAEVIGARNRRMDVGFRCVRPIFGFFRF